MEQPSNTALGRFTFKLYSLTELYHMLVYYVSCYSTHMFVIVHNYIIKK